MLIICLTNEALSCKTLGVLASYGVVQILYHCAAGSYSVDYRLDMQSNYKNEHVQLHMTTYYAA